MVIQVQAYPVLVGIAAYRATAAFQGFLASLVYLGIQDQEFLATAAIVAFLANLDTVEHQDTLEIAAYLDTVVHRVILAQAYLVILVLVYLAILVTVV